MIPSLIILAALIGVGSLLYIHDRLTRKKQPDEDLSTATEPESEPNDDECCGQHAVCEKFGDPLTDDLYYDDEELDRYAGRAADSYSEAEIAEFAEVLTSLKDSEYLSWARAIERRGINLPSEVRDELIMLLSD